MASLPRALAPLRHAQYRWLAASLALSLLHIGAVGGGRGVAGRRPRRRAGRAVAGHRARRPAACWRARCSAARSPTASRSGTSCSGSRSRRPSPSAAGRRPVADRRSWRCGTWRPSRWSAGWRPASTTRRTRRWSPRWSPPATSSPSTGWRASSGRCWRRPPGRPPPGSWWPRCRRAWPWRRRPRSALSAGGVRGGAAGDTGPPRSGGVARPACWPTSTRASATWSGRRGCWRRWCSPH